MLGSLGGESGGTGSVQVRLGGADLRELLLGGVALVFVVFLAYYWFYSRHRLVGHAPEEEFAQIRTAEAYLH